MKKFSNNLKNFFHRVIIFYFKSFEIQIERFVITKENYSLHLVAIISIYKYCLKLSILISLSKL